MTFEPEENRLDQSLRSKFDDFELVPGAPTWAGIEARLGPAPQLRPRRRPWLVPLLLVLTAFVAGLSGWLLPHAPAKSAVANRASTASDSRSLVRHNTADATSEPRSPLRNSGTAIVGQGGPSGHTGLSSSSQQSSLRRSIGIIPARQSQNRTAERAVATQQEATRNSGVIQPSQASRTAQLPADSATAAAIAATRVVPAIATNETAAPAPAEALPATLHPLVALERQTLVQLPSLATLATGPLAVADRNALLTSLRSERAELFRLQRRTDSLLLALGDLPSAPRLAARTDSTQPSTNPPKPAASKWSLLLTATPEQNTLALQGPEGDSLTALRRNHETGRAGFSAGLLAEYKLTPRLSVGGGVGYTALGADLRITNKTTEVHVRYDSVTTTTLGVFSSTYRTYSIRIVQVPQLSPVFNPNGQVIRYDTVYVPRRDTVFTTTVQHDTVRTNRTTVTPNISKKEKLTSRLYQPNYRFFTVPVLLRYRLSTPGTNRIWTDVALGAQLQFFLGGTQVATDDGENFRTERITVASSPFRALNVALSGALAINYALTPRISLSVAPSMRWQALSLYKPETGLRQQATSTGLMFGVRFGL